MNQELERHSLQSRVGSAVINVIKHPDLRMIVAEGMKKPLYSMSAGELGHTAHEVEERLHKVLELSTKWGAILLVDECDVFLEQRTTSDLERNKLVSGETRCQLRNVPTVKNELMLESSVPPFTRILQGRDVLDNQPRRHFRQRFPIPNPPYDRVPEAGLPVQDACMADLCPASE